MTDSAHILVVDNYDSFVYTIVGYLKTLGATVTVEDADTGEEREFTLLGPDEADYAKGTISIQSPVGVALLGKEVGDEITVNAPRGRINYEIIDIQFKKKTA